MGFVQVAPGSLEPIDRLRLVGAGMHIILLRAPSPPTADLLVPAPGDPSVPPGEER
jgi:hypothetical protein